jgi:N-acetylmuramic acid 6-phosphate (MurNAc-6-P) etherase
MTESESTADWISDHEKRRERERNEARERVRHACEVLTQSGATEVRIRYDGCGDSGAVESVTGINEAGEMDIPADIIETLIAAAENLLPHGWENHEGAFGEFVLDVASRSLKREHNWRIESTEYEEEGWEL